MRSDSSQGSAGLSRTASARIRRITSVLGLLALCVMLRVSSAETFVVTTSSASGEGSLRQAIIDANATAGLDTVVFNIPGSGPHVIMQSNSLPSLSDSTVIDGYTQPDAAPATENSPADIKIELNGGSSVNTGFRITAAGCTIRGLAVTGFAYGITLTGPGGTRIEGNHVGMDASGSFAGRNTVGIRILSQGHTIGGTDPGARNIISGNGEDGIRINTGHWSTEPGVGNSIQGNYIGTGVTGTTDLGNASCGIAIQWGADNLIGSGDGDAGNIIAYNQDVGVFVAHGIRNAILSNAVFSNGALGIDLLWDYWDSDPDGVNPNDAGDGDWGANELQNFPVLTSIAVTNDSTIIGGTLHSLPLTEFLIEFYSNSATDFTNYGEGQTSLGSSVVTTDEQGNGEFSAAFPLVLAPGLSISSTATDPLHNTSEFSLCLVYMGSLLVTNTNDTGPGSLRNAFTNANLTVGADTIAFDIPGPGPFTIRPAAALPGLNESVVIDGYTQPGASPASSLDPPVLQIELDGSVAGIGASGITLFGGSSTVRGLAINGFDAYGIILDQSGNNVIEGSFVGADISGTAERGNGGGIHVGSMGNTIGGRAPHARNVIAGNRGDGITVRGRDNLILGNFVGTDLSGTCALGNGNGIVLSSGNVVGGEEPEASNLVSGNLGDGIIVLGSENLIEGNRIGSGSAESSGNGGAGIRIGESSEPLFSCFAEEKGIHNDGLGETSVGPPVAQGNAILSNSISMNGGLGIDISPPGVNQNDSGDYDDGPNGGQNFPVLTQVLTSGDSTLIQGILNSTPGSAFRIDFFLSNAPDGTGYGEGETFLCTTNVATNGAGNAVIEAIVPSILPTGSFISCTATDSENNTSEFSQCLAIQGDMVVTNTKNSGPGSLRLAILTANTTDDPDTISFDTPGAGPHIIRLTSPLPDIVAPVVLDGYTQSGSIPATEAAPATLQIRLHGALTSQGSCGLSIVAGNSTVRGLLISAFPDCGIRLSENGNNLIEGNWIGVSSNAGGGNGACGILVLDSSCNTIGGMSMAARNIISGNQADGIRLDGADAYNNVVQGNFIGTSSTGMETCGNSGCGVAIGGPHNTIGGSAVAARNVISGNASNGVALDESGAHGNTVQGNFIGTDASGRHALGNGGCGIWVRTADNLIGGPAEGARNIISANHMGGICLAYVSARRNEVQGNSIGTDVSGELPLGNTGSGLLVRGASDNTVGGDQVNRGNLIAYNTEGGIAVTSGARNALLSNTISENGGLGIDLGNTGVTANDPGDGDSGANNLQNFPELFTALADSFWSITLEGLLNSTPNTLFTIQFFVSTTNDPSGYGEGGLFLGAHIITTDSQGNASFSATFTGDPLPAGSYASATATDPGNNTSEFGRSVPVQGVGCIEQPLVLIHGASESFPNPFSGRTQIKLSLADHSPVTLRIYNVAGELIRTMISCDMAPGVHTLMWDCRDVTGRLAPPGVYVYRVQAQRINQSGRMIRIEGLRD